MASEQTKTLIERMKNQVTFGHFLTIMSIFVFPAIGWVINAELRFQQTIKNRQEIQVVRTELKEEIEKREKFEDDIRGYFDVITEKLHSIELKVENKQDRK